MPLLKRSKVGILGVAPHANNIVDSFTPFELIFGDDMPDEDREKYRERMKAFRKDLGV